MKIKLRRHYCQLDNGPRVRCWYSRGSLGTATDAVTIYASGGETKNERQTK